jgi:two-component system, chemotaxis family, sensor kinase Cph1
VTGTAPRASLLLGVDPGVVRSEQVSLIERGSTLLLCTDGLVEQRDQVFDEGVELLGRLLPDRAEDDVALAAVRLRLPDGPGQPPT